MQKIKANLPAKFKSLTTDVSNYPDSWAEMGLQGSSQARPRHGGSIIEPQRLMWLLLAPCHQYTSPMRPQILAVGPAPTYPTPKFPAHLEAPQLNPFMALQAKSILWAMFDIPALHDMSTFKIHWRKKNETYSKHGHHFTLQLLLFTPLRQYK